MTETDKLLVRIGTARDAISRKTEHTSLDYMIDGVLMNCSVMLKEQEAKTGYWIDSAGNDKCSICGAEYSDLYPDYGNTHFCPNCGAKMKGR